MTELRAEVRAAVAEFRRESAATACEVMDCRETADPADPDGFCETCRVELDATCPICDCSGRGDICDICAFDADAAAQHGWDH